MKALLVLTIILSLAACDTFWNRSSVISADTKLFPECAYQAVSNIEGVTIRKSEKTDSHVVGYTPYSAFEISINKYGNVDIELVGRGFSPPRNSQQGVNNILSIISTKVANACNHS